MIRRLFIVAVSLAALTACTTYNSGYRHYSPAQAGYGDYYYAPDPGPSYYSPGYLHYPAYYSLYWGFDRHYYSSWHRPHFHYGVTWFPNDWFAFSVVHRYPRYSYWHPYAPYRYSAWDHRFAWHHYSPPRHRYRPAPRYGHPSNERRMQREHLAAERPHRPAPNAGVPRGRSALEAAAPQRLGSAPQRERTERRPRAAMREASRDAALAPGEARMRQHAGQARGSALHEETGRTRPALSERQSEQRRPEPRPWQQAQPAPRARSGIVADTAPSRSIPERRESQGPRQGMREETRQAMGEARRAPTRPVADGRGHDPRLGDAPRARPTAPAPVQHRQMPERAPVRHAPQLREGTHQAPARPSAPVPTAPRRNAMPPAAAPAAPPPRMQQAAPARAAPVQPPVQQAPARPARQAAPPTRPSSPRPSGRARSAIEQEH